MMPHGQRHIKRRNGNPRNNKSVSRGKRVAYRLRWDSVFGKQNRQVIYRMSFLFDRLGQFSWLACARLPSCMQTSDQKQATSPMMGICNASGKA